MSVCVQKHLTLPLIAKWKVCVCQRKNEQTANYSKLFTRNNSSKNTLHSASVAMFQNSFFFHQTMDFIRVSSSVCVCNVSSTCKYLKHNHVRFKIQNTRNQTASSKLLFHHRCYCCSCCCCAIFLLPLLLRVTYTYSILISLKFKSKSHFHA